MSTNNNWQETLKDGRHLLPSHIRPEHYQLTLEPLLENSEAAIEGKDLNFLGNVVVRLKILQTTNLITLHSKDLELTKVYCIFNSSETVPVSDISYDKEQQTVSLEFPKPFEASSEVTLYIDFIGFLNDKMVGFYRAKYRTKDGETRFMATTHFEPTDARCAFPCWDEPAVKATFEVTLIAPADRDCLSNMNVISEQYNDAGKKVVRFEKTPIMSTYLLVFIVGEFDYIEGYTTNGLPVRVYTAKESAHLGEFALNVGIRTLNFFTDFFGIPYPLPKMDFVAIPDFGSGAMENWGCITFRDMLLLVDPMNTSSEIRTIVAEVVAHELAHQWFGNLVTMEWWTHLWLNEGFATWAAYLAVDHLFPDWEVWKDFVSSTFASALKLDSLASSHPIEVDVKKASDVNEIFDAISYNKGASVIRMLADHMSLSSFQQGLQVYLKQFLYKNATTNDLWKTLEQVSGKPIVRIMSLWTRQTGYPLIEIKLNEKKEFILEQKRFLANGKPAGGQWTVMLRYIVSSSPSQVKCRLMEGPQEELNHVLGKQDKWLKVNAYQSGVYRVNYPQFVWEALSEATKNGELDAMDRLGLSMDSFALARSGFLPTSTALLLICSFKDETEYACWVNLLSNFEGLSLAFGTNDEHCSQLLNRFFCHILRGIASQLGWKRKEDEQHSISLLRPKHFNKYVEDPNSVDTDLRIVAMAAAVSQGGREEYEKVKEMYETFTLNEEKVRCLRVLGRIPDPQLAEKMLDWSWKHVRPGDFMFALYSLAMNRHKGPQLVWHYMQTHWNDLLERYGNGGNHMLSNLIRASTSRLSSKEDAQQVETFFHENQVEGCERIIEQSIEEINVVASWYQRDRENILSWLNKYLNE
ncbi:Puromycin-sensitive aminopeptidase [Galdieria sulphuraria]|nr:Puromycin-sensitive aminopeptidase [Galdieria sulphuraria]